MGALASLRRAAVRNLRSALPLAVAIGLIDWGLKALAVAANVEVHFAGADEQLVTGNAVVLGSAWIAVLAVAANTRLSRLALGAVLGTAFGNVGELLALGHVTDFIPFPPGRLASPADLAFCVGVALLGTDGVRLFTRPSPGAS